MRTHANEPVLDSRCIVKVPLTVVAVVAVALAAGKAQDWPASANATPVFASVESPASASTTRQSSRPALEATRAPAVIELDTTKINQYLSYDARAKTVVITLNVAANSTLGGFNFNGGSSGDQTITVPLGWTVSIDFHNHDAIPHSALVIKNQTPIPTMPADQPAISRAYTNHVSDGLPPQTGNDTMHFTAAPAGDYLIVCGVPGHAATGMYIHFVVSPRSAAPTNTGTIAAP